MRILWILLAIFTTGCASYVPYTPMNISANKPLDDGGHESRISAYSVIHYKVDPETDDTYLFETWGSISNLPEENITETYGLSLNYDFRAGILGNLDFGFNGGLIIGQSVFATGSFYTLYSITPKTNQWSLAVKPRISYTPGSDGQDTDPWGWSDPYEFTVDSDLLAVNLSLPITYTFQHYLKKKQFELVIEPMAEFHYYGVKLDVTSSPTISDTNGIMRKYNGWMILPGIGFYLKFPKILNLGVCFLVHEFEKDSILPKKIIPFAGFDIVFWF